MLDLRASDCVLELGCGEGYLVELFAPRVELVTGVDAAPALVTAARRRLEHLPNVSVWERDLSVDPPPDAPHGKGYSLIVCHSMMQYFPTHAAVERFVDALCSVAAPGARLLVADLPRSDSLTVDAMSQLYHGFSGGYAFGALRALGTAPFSSYRAVRRQHGVLKFTSQRLVELGGRFGAHVRVIEGRLTANAARIHLFAKR